MTNKAKHKNTCLFLLSLGMCGVQQLFLSVSAQQRMSVVFVMQSFAASPVFKCWCSELCSRPAFWFVICPVTGEIASNSLLV